MIDWTASKNDWIADVTQLLMPRLRADNRFVGFSKLEDNFNNAVSAWRAGASFRQAIKCGNELAAAAALLSRTAGDAQVYYERRLLRTRKSIDFCVEAANGRLEWLDVKTVAPKWQDDDPAWKRFERIAADFPANARLIVHREFAGAALAGNALKSRWSLAQRAMELEEKQLLLDTSEHGPVRLLLCSEGAWHLDELEDLRIFIAQDSFATMTGRRTPSRAIWPNAAFPFKARSPAFVI